MASIRVRFPLLYFFIYYMSLVGCERKEMFIASGVFATTVFVASLLLGMGILKFLSFLNEFFNDC